VSEGASPRDGRSVLVLGDAEGLAAALVLRLQQRGVRVEVASALSDSETSAILAQGWCSAVCVVTRDDVLALRLTLLSAHLRPDLPLWVTMFDRTITRELLHVAPAVHVLSPSELVASDLAELLQCRDIGELYGSEQHADHSCSAGAERLERVLGLGRDLEQASNPGCAGAV